MFIFQIIGKVISGGVIKIDPKKKEVGGEGGRYSGNRDNQDHLVGQRWFFLSADQRKCILHFAGGVAPPLRLLRDL